MFIKNVCGEVQAKIENPSLRFLLMFMGVVPGSLILFTTGLREFSMLQQLGLAWSMLALALFMSTSLFGRNAPTILTALPFISPRGK